MWPDEQAEVRAIRLHARRLSDLFWEDLQQLTGSAAQKAAVLECVAEVVFDHPSELANARQWIQWEAQMMGAQHE